MPRTTGALIPASLTARAVEQVKPPLAAVGLVRRKADLDAGDVAAALAPLELDALSLTTVTAVALSGIAGHGVDVLDAVERVHAELVGLSAVGAGPAAREVERAVAHVQGVVAVLAVEHVQPGAAGQRVDA